MDANWALAIITIALTVITALYVYETHQMVHRMDKQLEAATQPFIAVSLVPWSGRLIKLRVQNVGLGPALHVKGSVITDAIDEGEYVMAWSYDMLLMGHYEEFGLLTPNASDAPDRLFDIDEIRSRVTKVRSSFTYDSANGRKYATKDVIDIQSLTEDWLASRMLATQDHPDRLLPRIAKALEELRDFSKR